LICILLTITRICLLLKNQIVIDMKKLLLITLLFCVKQIDAQIINTVAGGGSCGSNYCGNGGQATAAEIWAPAGITTDVAGNLYFAEIDNNCIRKVNSLGIISTVAGNGTGSYSGDGGPATAATLNSPYGVALDAVGNIYIVDNGNNCIRMVNTLGVITTIAGTGTGSFSGDGGQATAATLHYPIGITLDATGNIYIADWNNRRVRKVNTLGIINTIAGNGTVGFSGDGGQATAAELYNPLGLAVDGLGNIYIADAGNSNVRQVNASGIITTVVGNGTAGYSGDGGLANAAEINGPYGVTVDAAGNLYVADSYNNCIRMVNTSGIINTIVGNGTAGYSGNGGQATAAELNFPEGVAVDPYGNIYIADTDNDLTRKVCNYVPTLSLTSSSYSVCYGTSQTLSVSGANTYVWSPAASLNNPNSATPTAHPTETTIYSVIGTNLGGCKSNIPANVTVTVEFLPTILLRTSSDTICLDSSAILNSSGAISYTWSTGNTTNEILVTPTVTTTYTVTGIGSDGCVNTATITQTVINCAAGIETFNEQHSMFKIYPNPSMGNIHISSVSNELNIEIQDVTGRSIITQSLPVSNGIAQMQTNLVNGVYLVIIKESLGKVTAQKLIINN
jgi:sugar lactone lactonase YvrE